MLGKLIIIGIVAAALVVLVPSLGKMLDPNTSIKEIKQKIDYVTSDGGANKTLSTLSSIGKSIKSLNGTNPISLYSLAPQYVDTQNYTGQVFEKTGSTCYISVPDMAMTINGQKELTHIIQIGKCTYGVGDPVQVTTITAKPNMTQAVDSSSAISVVPYVDSSVQSNSSSTDSSGSIVPSASASPSLPTYYKTITMSAQNQGNNIIIKYDDTSGKTQSVTVTMRNSDKQIFSGTYTSSQFETTVNDIPQSPHMIDMTIQNSVYGTLHASVYAPTNIRNSTISGIFTQN